MTLPNPVSGNKLIIRNEEVIKCFIVQGQTKNEQLAIDVNNRQQSFQRTTSKYYQGSIVFKLQWAVDGQTPVENSD